MKGFAGKISMRVVLIKGTNHTFSIHRPRIAIQTPFFCSTPITELCKAHQVVTVSTLNIFPVLDLARSPDVEGHIVA